LQIARNPQELQILGQLSQLMQAPQPKIMTVDGALVRVNPDGTAVPIYEGASDFDENLSILGKLNELPPEQQELYAKNFGKGGTTVNVGGQDMSPFEEESQKSEAKSFVSQREKLQTEAVDLLTQAQGSQQALEILKRSPDIDISPTAPISTGIKELVAPFLTPEELDAVADYRQLESQLIRNRFDVTKVLKGAITEQEQAAAQQVAGSATGTQQGLTQTLINNIAFSTLQADEKERRAEYIREVGRNYSPRKFRDYYKDLGEKGARPTLDSILGELGKSYNTGSQKPKITPEQAAAELRRRKGQ
jgi:hypothetical protein